MEPYLQLSEKVKKLTEKGVAIPQPTAVEIGADVDIRRIAGSGVVLHPGTRIHGKNILIGAGSKIGGEGPTTLINCQLGRDVELKGGFFKESLFLDRVSIGSGAQIREGCILEEESGGNHTIGLKQTILFPYVTLGSLINFCDCFMAGGTDRKNHSEIGSSFIHFNYTPNQDKATPSLLGDVPRGVMLNQPPIFLGGQGGLAGPIRIGFGTVTPAGTILRRDCPEGGKILNDHPVCVEDKEFYPGYYPEIRRRVINNIYYLANILALKAWYTHVRALFFGRQDLGSALGVAAAGSIQGAFDERQKRFRELVEKMPKSITLMEENRLGKPAVLLQQRELVKKWPDLQVCIQDKTEDEVNISDRDVLIRTVLEKLEQNQTDYVSTVRSLHPDVKARGTAWLQAIVDHVVRKAVEVIPSFRDEKS